MTTPEFRVRWVEETGSTNTDLLERAAAGEPEGAVLAAHYQHGGRGRHGRMWTAPRGASLLVSVLLRPELAPRDLAAVTAAAGLAAAEAVEQEAGVVAQLKWPNDLVVDVDGVDRKLAGLLADSHLEGRATAAVVVGMGLNVDWPETLPPDLAETATALNHLIGAPPDRAQLLEAWLAALGPRYASLGEAGGIPGIWAAWRERSATLGRRVRVELADTHLEGTATDVTAQGRLVLDATDGQHVLSAGDVIHLRPA